jgi:hypothetical protein
MVKKRKKNNTKTQGSKGFANNAFEPREIKASSCKLAKRQTVDYPN